MKIERSKPIIAVFGSSKHGLKLAEELGARIVEKNMILLTGGKRGKDKKRVSERAIDGALTKGNWVGVARTTKKDPEEQDLGIILHTDLDHYRNYLEACLCDAAIAIKGGPGTTSEVVLALALQRPVALVGPWEHELTSSRLDEMVEEAFRIRLKRPSNNRDIARWVKKEVIREKLKKELPPNTCFFGDWKPLEMEKQKFADDAVDWIREQVSMRGLVGEFPKIEGYDEISAKYAKWLETAGSSLGDGNDSDTVGESNQ